MLEPGWNFKKPYEIQFPPKSCFHKALSFLSILALAKISTETIQIASGNYAYTFLNHQALSGRAKNTISRWRKILKWKHETSWRLMGPTQFVRVPKPNRDGQGFSLRKWLWGTSNLMRANNALALFTRFVFSSET